MLPVFGKIKGGNSDIISLFKNLRKITPVRANPVIANNEYQKYCKSDSNSKWFGRK